MSNQNEFKSAILTELGIPAWKLSDKSLLDSQIQDSILVHGKHVQERSCQEIYKQQKEQPSLNTIQSEIEPEPVKSSPEKDKHALETVLGNEKTELQDVHQPVDLNGCVVLLQALEQRLPQWWKDDVLLALKLAQTQLIVLDSSQTTVNREQAILIVKSGNKCELTHNVLTLPSNVTSVENKKSLWMHLKSLVQ